jgi:hypothetical protein
VDRAAALNRSAHGREIARVRENIHVYHDERVRRTAFATEEATLTDSFPAASRPNTQEQMMKGQESKKAAKKEPAKTMKEKKADKKAKKEEKQRL